MPVDHLLLAGAEGLTVLADGGPPAATALRALSRRCANSATGALRPLCWKQVVCPIPRRSPHISRRMGRWHDASALWKRWLSPMPCTPPCSSADRTAVWLRQIEAADRIVLTQS